MIDASQIKDIKASDETMVSGDLLRLEEFQGPSGGDFWQLPSSRCRSSFKYSWEYRTWASGDTQPWADPSEHHAALGHSDFSTSSFLAAKILMIDA